MTSVIPFAISSILPLWLTQPPILLVSEMFLQLTCIQCRRLRKTETVLSQEGQVGYSASPFPSQSNNSDFIPPPSLPSPPPPQMEAITSSPCYRAVIPRNSEVGTQSGAGQEIGGVEEGWGGGGSWFGRKQSETRKLLRDWINSCICSSSCLQSVTRKSGLAANEKRLFFGDNKSIDWNYRSIWQRQTKSKYLLRPNYSIKVGTFDYCYAYVTLRPRNDLVT
jgi:hypothetical protein